MPGSRIGRSKTVVVQVRLSAPELALWKTHVARAGGYLSVLVRRAVAEHIDGHRGAKKPPGLYEWERREEWDKG